MRYDQTALAPPAIARPEAQYVQNAMEPGDKGAGGFANATI